MKAVVLFSGGKDSTASLHLSFFTGIDVRGLCIAKPLEDSMIFHHPYTEYAVELAKLMGFDYYYERTDDDIRSIESFIENCCDNFRADYIITGVIRSDYQRVRLAQVARKLGKGFLAPLWGYDPEKYLRYIYRVGIRFIVVRSMAYGFPKELVGKVIEDKDIDTLLIASRKYKFNPAFEGGEAETLVVKAPLMRKYIHVDGIVQALPDEVLNYFIIQFRIE